MTFPAVFSLVLLVLLIFEPHRVIGRLYTDPSALPRKNYDYVIVGGMRSEGLFSVSTDLLS